MPLTEEQKFQINRQLRAHRHRKYSTDIVLDKNHILRCFSVHPNVLRPDQMTALHLARFLLFNKKQYRNKVCIDMGCGTGIQGIVMSLFGASKIVFSDIWPHAIENTKSNIKQFNLHSKAIVVQGDLFEKIKVKADVIVFNHPFFPEKPNGNIPVSISMLDSGQLIHRFLRDARGHLKNSGKIFMPFLDMAGATNNPKVQARKHHYKIRTRASYGVMAGLQKGNISIFELTTD